MKKIIALLMALALVFTVCAFASADDMEISYTTETEYILTIPATTSLNGKSQISLTNTLITSGKEYAVEMTSANDFNLECGESKIPYKVSVGDLLLRNDIAKKVVLIVKAGNKNGNSAELGFLATENDIANATLAGEHTDILSFTVSPYDLGSCEVGYEGGTTSFDY